MSRLSRVCERFKRGTKIGEMEIIGDVFYQEHGGKTPKRRPHCRVRCSCGQESTVLCFNLKPNSTCEECLARKASRFHFPRKHGFSRTRLHGSWKNMLARCLDHKNQAFANYGGRGITVCEEWQKDFLAFRAWALASGYTDDLEIDRVDTNGNYEPGNCRWATPTEQNRNRRDNRIVEAFGESKCLAAWAEDPRCATTYVALQQRIQAGWAPERALRTPTRRWPSQMRLPPSEGPRENAEVDEAAK